MFNRVFRQVVVEELTKRGKAVAHRARLESSLAPSARNPVRTALQGRQAEKEVLAVSNVLLASSARLIAPICAMIVLLESSAPPEPLRVIFVELGSTQQKQCNLPLRALPVIREHTPVQVMLRCVLRA